MIRSRCLYLLMIAACALACNKPATAPPLSASNEKVIAQQKKVLLIGIDGCRGDAMKFAKAPNIRILEQHAVYSYDALTQPPTWSGPGWSSMLTGVWGNKHGVTNNTFSGSNYGQYPMLFKYLKQANSQLRTVSICSWAPINDKIVSDADVKINVSTDLAVKDSTVAQLKNSNPDILFADFNDVDYSGHANGFDTSVTQYMTAITKTDEYIGNIMDALKQRPNYDKEDWLVIISSDHGGNMSGHGGTSYEEQNIPLLIHNKNFLQREVVKPVSNTSFVKFQNKGQYAFTNNVFYNFGAMLKFTIEFRIRTAGLNSDPPFIGNKNWGSGGNRGWVINVRSQSWKFNAGDGSRRVDVNSNAPNLNDNLWHHIAVSVDRAGQVRLYQDGKFYNSGSMTTLTTLDPANAIKLIMAEDITTTYGASYGNSVFNMADVRLWNTALDAQTIQDFSKCDTLVTADHPYFDNLIGWWKGGDGKGNVMKDASVKKIDMQIINNPPWEETGKNFCGQLIPSDVPKIVDVAPRIISWFNIPIDYSWKLDGKVWFDR